MNIIVSGSLAYDRIMNFPGHFSEHILPEKIHVLNVCFQVNGVKEKFGGTAGNIAYALTLMGEKPFISATIGHDYQRYFEWLSRNGITTEGIKIIEDELTAGAYITTDKADNQITGFNPGAMKYSSCLDFDKLDPKETLIIVSPGNLGDMVNYPRICKERGIDYIFDPGQSLPMWDAKDLVRSIEGCRILIVNDYELDLIMNKTGIEQKRVAETAQGHHHHPGRAWFADLDAGWRNRHSGHQDGQGQGSDGRRRFLPGRSDQRSDPRQGHRAMRQDGQRMRLLCRRVLRHPGIQLHHR